LVIWQVTGTIIISTVVIKGIHDILEFVKRIFRGDGPIQNERIVMWMQTRDLERFPATGAVE
jgi:hypothetical protein